MKIYVTWYGSETQILISAVKAAIKEAFREIHGESEKRIQLHPIEYALMKQPVAMQMECEYGIYHLTAVEEGPPAPPKNPAETPAYFLEAKKIQ